MRRINFSCLLLGHDDAVRRTRERLFLECRDCGRTTPGWPLGPNPGRAAPGRSRGQPVAIQLRGRVSRAVQLFLDVFA